MKRRKTKYKEPEYVAWIRNHYCAFCGGYDDYDGQNELPLNTPFHIKTRGSGGEDFDNLVASCSPCHTLYENNHDAKHSKYDLARKLTHEFKVQKASKEMWARVHALQRSH